MGLLAAAAKGSLSGLRANSLIRGRTNHRLEACATIDKNIFGVQARPKLAGAGNGAPPGGTGLPQE